MGMSYLYISYAKNGGNMQKKDRKLDAKSLNLGAILRNSDRAVATNRLSERGARGFLGSSFQDSVNWSSKRRFYRKEASFLSR